LDSKTGVKREGWGRGGVRTERKKEEGKKEKVRVGDDH